MKKNDVVYGCVIDYTHEGLGVVKVDGFPIFVKDMLIGECGEIICTLVKKNFAFGRKISLVKESEHRVSPPCEVVKQCGGCQIMHMSAAHQNEFKTNRVITAMQRIAKMDVNVEPIISMENPWGYRNKVQIPVEVNQNDVRIGFYRLNSHDIIDMNQCLVQSVNQNAITQWVKRFLKKNPIEDIRHLIIKESISTQQIMVAFVVGKENIPFKEALVSQLVEKFSNITSVMLSINARNDNVVIGDKDVVLYRSDAIEDILMGKKFRIALRSFYQINPSQTQVLYQIVKQFADLQGNEIVLDLFCGVGTIGIILADEAKMVIGVDVIEDSILDAQHNAKINEINNIEFLNADVNQIKYILDEMEQSVDIVVVDPPRKGLEAQTILDIIALNPAKIIYVSCDPGTLARDCGLFKEHYNIAKVQPVDMFPQTFHVETVVLLSLK